MPEYRKKSMRQLFCCYAHENGRICKAEAAVTKFEAQREMHRRLKAALAALDEAQAYEDGEVIFDRFLNGQL